MFNDVYRNKKVLVTGHTGFKGSWLALWLLELGAEVIGISKDVPTSPSLYNELGLKDKIVDYEEDVRDLEKMTAIVSLEKPDFIFHLAAQPIVSTSYIDPIETISSNVMGTANILEALRVSNHICVAIIITSDKAYDNVEQIWGYKEDDHLGGKDVYSGSKGAAELIIKSYYYSFLRSKDCNVRLGIGRAGNVIGGGDWALDRIIVDCMKAWSEDRLVEIRSPNATRPWQHVLEPLSGYLAYGAALWSDFSLHGHAINFGPRAEQNHTVKTLLEDLTKYWEIDDPSMAFSVTANLKFHEAGLLKLNCDKALAYLKWQANLSYSETIEFTGTWYFNFYKKDTDMYEFTRQQIKYYGNLADDRNMSWAK